MSRKLFGAWSVLLVLGFTSVLASEKIVTEGPSRQAGGAPDVADALGDVGVHSIGGCGKCA